VRSIGGLGLAVTAALIRIRLGSSNRVYPISIPRWHHPVYVRGGKSSDTTVLYEILVTNEYHLVEGLNSPRTIVDGGANIGLAAVYFLNRYPSVRVISVEPFAETFEVCEKNLAPYKGRATALKGAIWSHGGRVSLDPQWEDWVNKVRAPAPGETGTAEAITMPSLIATAGGFVDLLKLDVEGSEREIFGPGAKDWLPFVGNIVIELHGADCKERFFEALSPYEYEVSSRDMVYYCRNLRLRTSV